MAEGSIEALLSVIYAEDEEDLLATGAGVADIHSLFVHYNDLYFSGRLGACSVEWSSARMTRCAGVCHYERGGGCRIKLSEPLLKLRPLRDLKDTLLHEMIHADLFLAGVRDDSRDGHGTVFRAAAAAINSSQCADPERPPGGYRVTVYHSMHAEVAHYQTHVWACTRCGASIARASNRPPQEADCRSYTRAGAAAAAAAGRPGAYCSDPRCAHHSHARGCGGAYIKMSEPDKPAKPPRGADRSSSSKGGRRTTLPLPAPPGVQSIRRFLPHGSSDGGSSGAGGSSSSNGGGIEDQGMLQQQQPPQPLAQSLPAQQQQQQQQQGMRRTADDYWQSVGRGHRLGGGGTSAASRPGNTPEVVELLSSDDDEGGGGVDHGGPRSGRRQPTRHASYDASTGAQAVVLRATPATTGSSSGSRSGTAQPSLAALLCPVCGVSWPPDCGDAALLQAHVEACLVAHEQTQC